LQQRERGRTPRVTKIEVSVILPVLDEVESLGVLHRELTEALQRLGRSYEIIFVDDGSRDGSFQRIEKLRLEDPRVRGMQLRRNFGKAAALAVGFGEAQGDVVVTLDADLQDDPAEIPKLLARLEDGFDLVSGWKQDRQDPRSKTWPSRLFNWVTGLLTGVRLHDFNSGFKIYRREVVREIRLYGELTASSRRSRHGAASK
jgi:glycosyltransferase involved in cell wall biosynthesis